MTSSWQKFKLLMWKNWVLQTRHKIRMVFEILIPIVFIALLVLIRSLVEPKLESALKFSEFKVTNMVYGNASFFRCDYMEKIKISYSPMNKSSQFDPAKLVIKGALEYMITENIDVLLENVDDIQQNPTMNSSFSCLAGIADLIDLDNLPSDEVLKNTIIDFFFDLQGFSDAAALEQQLINPILNDTSICGIQFDDGLINIQNINDWPKDIRLTLRFPAELRMVDIPVPFLNWRTDIAFPIFQFPGPRTKNDMYGGWPGYMQEGFLPLAHSIFHEITRIVTNATSQPTIWARRFPHPEFVNDFLLYALQGFVSLFVILSFTYSCINTIRTIALEKEKQLKEVMKIMGLSNWLHWVAWFLKSFIYLLISIAFIVVLVTVRWYTTEEGLNGYAVFTYTPWHMILFFLVIYIITSICFCFMISTFFSKSNTAATVGGLAWFLTYVPYTFLASDQVIPTTTARVLSCLASNTAMSFGFQMILQYEASGEGMQWSKLFTPMTVDDPFVMGHIILMLIFDAILYLLIALYVEQIFPGAYGVPQPWYFPVSPKFWKNTCCSNAIGEHDDNEYTIDNEAVEPDPKGFNVGINIKNLSKKFKQKTAVDKLNLKIFEDQITVLLGHNGAGKTTTMSMLTGVLPPTSGTATVAGYDIRTDINNVRNSLGLCPQHNVLFSDLTVAEHIYFYARLKGMSGNEISDEIDKYTKLLGLEDKKNVYSSELSGGMQRRLSIGTALCGGSKVVLLDEPSSGMDPSARRELWDLLHMEKKGRTLILTTHFMDEAEILGERVAILSDGTLRCVGSPFFLKKKFGIGYKLTAARQPSSVADGHVVPAAPVTELLVKHIPSVKLYTDIGSEISFVLPDEDTGKFEGMLRELEDRQHELGLMGFGISASTLEEVFMRVGADVNKYNDDDIDNNYKTAPLNNHDGYLDTDSRFVLSDSTIGTYTGTRLMINQIKAMFLKKLVCAWRSWVIHLIQLIIPIGLVAISILAVRMYETPKELPPRILELSNGYAGSITTMNEERNLINDTVKKAYKSFFTKMQLDDIGTKDMSDYYLENAVENMPTLRAKNVAGVTIGNANLTAWFSNFPHHDLPSSVMMVQNSILKSLSSNNTLTLINYPLPFSLDAQFKLLAFGDSGSFQIALNITLSMAFVSGLFIFFYVKESVSRSKLLQLASGASPLTFWNVAFFCDLVWMVVISVVTCGTLAAFQQRGLRTVTELARVFLVVWLFGWAILPINYLFSSSFKAPSSGFNKMLLFNCLTGMGLFITVDVLYTPGLALEGTADILNYIFLLFPHFAVARAVKYLTDASITIQTCDFFCSVIPNCTKELLCERQKSCCISDDPFFEWEKPGILSHMTYMIVVGIVCFVLLIAKEYEIQYLFWKPRRSLPPPIERSQEDSDVADERARVKSLAFTEYTKYNLLAKDLSKYYQNFLAVDQLTFGVKDGECFGLLGINGAGKTTTFKMLIGDLRASCGEAWVKGFSINTDMKKVHKKIGYCPQFDALLDEMTGRETLKMYSLLRGIPKWQQENYISELSQRLGFTKHLDKEVNQYSGGNKRKLSTSVALLGNPQVVYLDEPTTGMDPAAKRLVWNAISECNCVILTSHSMEECEALCTRLAIMVNGRPQCLGSPQHLKNKFSQGYTLIVKLKRIWRNDEDVSTSNGDKFVRARQPFSQMNDDVGMNIKKDNFLAATTMFNFNTLHDFLLSKFPDAKIMESFQGVITYQLPATDIRWSEIFGIMESAKDQLGIEDYSIGQTSLEQIFLQFTKDQIATNGD